MQPVFHVDYEFYILVSNAIVDQMVHRVPLNILTTFHQSFLSPHLQNKIKRILNLKPVVNEMLNAQWNPKLSRIDREI